MIEVNPKTINGQELAALALRAKGSVKRIYRTGRRGITTMFMTIII